MAAKRLCFKSNFIIKTKNLPITEGFSTMFILNTMLRLMLYKHQQIINQLIQLHYQ